MKYEFEKLFLSSILLVLFYFRTPSNNDVFLLAKKKNKNDFAMSVCTKLITKNNFVALI